MYITSISMVIFFHKWPYAWLELMAGNNRIIIKSMLPKWYPFFLFLFCKFRNIVKVLSFSISIFCFDNVLNEYILKKQTHSEKVVQEPQ